MKRNYSNPLTEMVVVKLRYTICDPTATGDPGGLGPSIGGGAPGRLYI